MVRRCIYKSQGKFKLALIDIKDNMKITSRTVPVSLSLTQTLKVTQAPSLFLMYRENLTQELTGVPTKTQMSELLKTALFFYQVANEEILADSLIKEGTRCIEESKLADALHLFEEANSLEKWRDIYGTMVLANMAFICVKQGNYMKAR